MDSKEITAVKNFIEAINLGNASLLFELMTEDHTFIDAQGTEVTGRNEMKEGWEEYFHMFPDYKIEAENILNDGNLAAVFGSASGTYNGKRGMIPENIIKMPAAWKAIIENGKIKLWQVYADWTEGFKTIQEDNEADIHGD